jgi:glutathione synthase/RimK-type ligase-like ATP-grasp enzyme
LIARPIGSHAGQSLEKIETPVDLLDYLSRVIGDTFYISRFVDYRSEDGQFRKYRIVLIDGAPYICHMAISSHWMVHYLNAGMDESAEKRHAEAECMANFELQFARKHAKALAEIGKRIGLSYVGIDCAEAPNGDLLVFEVDNAMVVHSMDPEDRYAYKKPIMQKLFRAFRTMLRLAPYTAR